MKEWIWKLRGIIFIASLTGISYIVAKHSRENLINRGVIVNGIVIGTKLGKSNYFMKYEFRYKKGVFEGLQSTRASNFDAIERILVGKYFPVLVEEGNV